MTPTRERELLIEHLRAKIKRLQRLGETSHPRTWPFPILLSIHIARTQLFALEAKLPPLALPER